MSETNNDLVYRQVIDNKLALKQLQKFEQKLIQHEKRVQRLKQRTAQIEVKEARKTATVKERAQSKEVAAKARSELQKQKLAEKTARKEKQFEKWKTAQFRSATYARLNIEQQMNLKRILNSQKTEEEIREDWKKSTSIFLREQKRRKMMQKNREKVNTGGNVGKNAASGAAGGGLLAGAMMNPYALAVGATVAGGAMAVKAGSEDFKTLSRNAQLTGMDFNTFSRETAGMAAVSGISQDQIAEGVMKDINDRAGEFLNEATFNQKTGQFEGGEGSIMANMLMSQGGMSREQVVQTMQLDPAEFIKTVSTALEGVDQKSITFAGEAFSSDLANVIIGMQQNRSGYETAKANATTFNDNDIAKAKEFQLALSGIASSLGQIPLNIFKEFTNSLSPQTLEMLGKLGESISKLGGIFGDILAVILNLVSVGLSPLLDVVNWLLDAIKPLTQIMGEWSQSIQTTYDVIQNMVKNFVQGLLSSLPDWMIPDSLKEKADTKPDSQTPTTNTTTPTPDKPIPQPYNMQKPTLPAYNPYGNLGVNNNSTTNTVTNNNNTQTRVVLELNGNEIASTVIGNNQFGAAVDRQMGSGMVGAR